MHLKDALVGMLTWLGILSFIVIASSLEGWPIWGLIILAVIVWIVYILIIIREYQRNLKYPFVRISPQEVSPSRKNAPKIYDQEEDQ